MARPAPRTRHTTPPVVSARSPDAFLASFAAVFGMIGLNGLPQPYHPIFNAKNFERATDDRFFLCIEATDPKFDPKAVEQFLKSLNPLGVTDCAQ